MNWLSKRLSWVLMLASATLFYLPLGNRALWNSDEGRYAEIAREMLELKDWITPHLNYVLYFEKPPLMYWLTSLSFLVFGPTAFAARFWCATFGLLTVGVTYLIGKHWRSERAGLLAGGILATSFGFFFLTQFLVLDMALTFWMTLALYASSRILQERPPEAVKRYATLLAFAMAGGILTKGLIAIVFPVGILGLALAYTRLGVQTRKIPWPRLFLFTAILASPWFILVSLRHPSFIPFFFIREHFERFLTTVHHRSEPFYFFIPVLLVGFLPWTVFLPKILISAFKNHGTAMKRDPVMALLMIWSFLIVIFFSFSQSKLAGYILPVFPALALLGGNAFEDALDLEDIPSWLEGGVISMIVIFIAALCLLKLPLSDALYSDPIAMTIRTNSGTLSLTLALGVFVLVGIWGMRQSTASLAGIMIIQVLLLSTISSLSIALDPQLSNKGLARIVALRAAPEDRVVVYGVSYENQAQALLFYAKRRLAVYGDPGELEMGRDQSEDAADWFSPETDAKTALSRLPIGSWIVTNGEYLKGLSQDTVAATLETITHEGPLILLRKVQ